MDSKKKLGAPSQFAHKEEKVSFLLTFYMVTFFNLLLHLLVRVQFKGIKHLILEPC